MSNQLPSGFCLTPQSTFPTTEDARASYGFARPEASPTYTLQPEAPGTEPAGFDSHPPAVLVGDSAALFADVRRKYEAATPGTRFTADYFRLSEVLDHAEAALAASQQQHADALDNAGYMTSTAETVALRQQLAEATRELEYERQMRQQTEKAMSTLAGRVKEQQAELAEQEVAKIDLILHNVRQRAALERTADALANCYDVTDYPASGKSACDVALLEARRALAPVPALPPGRIYPRHEVKHGFNPVPTPEAPKKEPCCHGAGLASHRQRCVSESCDHKQGNAAATEPSLCN